MKASTSASHRLNRIEQVLDYVDQHISQPISLELLAEKSCWSRWQLQRVFQTYTGKKVAQYVREQKLSHAAELVLGKQQRMLDIASACGFGSEIAFSRAFKKQFGLSPKQYQLRGTRTGICQRVVRAPQPSSSQGDVFYQVKIEHSNRFDVVGVCQLVQGLMSTNPDYLQTVPLAWQHFQKLTHEQPFERYVGVFQFDSDILEGSLSYFAGTDAANVTHPLSETLDLVSIDEGQYAVLKYEGEIERFSEAVSWFIFHWLPHSSYIALDGSEIEVYQPQTEQGLISVEYWLPVAPKDA
ncbi:AraC family transcriptional regulator [Vibrio sp. SCSIO 43135]|uniref:AraC family transcriptional regulator n=1 Tax=Vibrio sp. SCSIO 43135 TaxID=2819096 RepID=UPI00207554CA|nr:AraC family transcriptional regulator [Vibrio sp. SCSIO 43135]USD40277.1 AraC family transcriptional regulator [Vibrio sp. SCSIO 43135]